MPEDDVEITTFHIPEPPFYSFDGLCLDWLVRQVRNAWQLRETYGTFAKWQQQHPTATSDHMEKTRQCFLLAAIAEDVGWRPQYPADVNVNTLKQIWNRAIAECPLAVDAAPGAIPATLLA